MSVKGRGFTAFHTTIGTYKWNVLPQGTSVSPQIFQRAMDRWFSAFLWKSVIVWVDDLLVHSRTFQDHLIHLRGVLEVARKYGLVFNKEKLKLCQREVKYIGYIFGENGIATDPDKVSAVHDIPRPTTRKQVKSFLGFAGFYRRFMPPAYASIISPLTELTKPSKPFKWDGPCQRSFDRVKLLLTTTPVLVHTRILNCRFIFIVTRQGKGSAEFYHNMSMGRTNLSRSAQRSYYCLISRTGRRPSWRPMRYITAYVSNGDITSL